MAAIWGGSFLAVKMGVTVFPPFLFAALRFVFSAFPFVFFIPRPAGWSFIIGSGLGLSLQFGCLFVGLKMGAPAGLASLLQQIQVIFTALVGTLVFKESLRPIQWVGILIASFGMVGIALSKSQQPGQSMGLLLVIIGSFGWMASNFFMKRSGAKNALHMMIWVSLITPVPLLLLSFLFERHLYPNLFSHIEVRGVLALIYISYGSTLISYTIWGMLLNRYPASVVAPFSMLVPVFGMSLAWFIYNETLSWRAVLSSVLILVGICLVVFQWRRILFWKPKKPEQILV